MERIVILTQRFNQGLPKEENPSTETARDELVLARKSGVEGRLLTTVRTCAKAQNSEMTIFCTAVPVPEAISK